MFTSGVQLLLEQLPALLFGRLNLLLAGLVLQALLALLLVLNLLEGLNLLLLGLRLEVASDAEDRGGGGGGLQHVRDIPSRGDSVDLR